MEQWSTWGVQDTIAYLQVIEVNELIIVFRLATELVGQEGAVTAVLGRAVEYVGAADHVAASLHHG